MEEAETACAEGDLGSLTDAQRARHYQRVCDSLGLNALTRPFEYLWLNGRLVLYAKRDATDQLRRKDQVSIEILDRSIEEGLYLVRARATLPSGRTDESLGAVSVAGLAGEARANALMTAETKAKRRATLSVCGLGMLDETEVDSIPSARRERGPTESPSPDVTPTEILQLWDAKDAASRADLYRYAKTTFGKRVIALTPDELEDVRRWMSTGPTGDAREEDHGDAA